MGQCRNAGRAHTCAYSRDIRHPHKPGLMPVTTFYQKKGNSMKEFVWSDFYRITRNNAPWPRLVRAVSLLGHTGEALDLGCGAGRDTRYLLERGFSVTAVDREAASLATLVDL